MSKERHGMRWTKKEDKLLVRLFKECCSYHTMAKELNRSWFACKCRLARLGLIKDEFEMPKEGILYVNAPYEVPNKGEGATFRFDIFEDLSQQVFKDEEDTSKTFSDAELNIVIDYFKTRLARLAIQKLDTKCFQRGLDISIAEDIFISEINKIKNVKTMTIEEREKVLSRIA